MRRLFASLPDTVVAVGTSGEWTVTKMEINYRAPETKDLTEENGFYAVLRMDIDGLGAADKASYKAVSTFARAANSIVNDHAGYTIYSGGDDVLAFVPAMLALDCAAALRWRLNQVQNLNPIQLTASAAVLICHYKSPMADALHRSQKLLANIAKDATGRDALAVQLCKPGSDVQTYSAPWEVAWIKDTLNPDAIPKLIINEFASTMGKSEGFSTGYIYWLRNFYNQVNMARRIAPNSDLWTDTMLELMVTQYLHQQRSGDGAAYMYTHEEASAHLEPLIKLSRQYLRLQQNSLDYKIECGSVFSAQAALIGRFLASMLPEMQKKEYTGATV
jgi:CRISPR-associated protein Cmr2